MGADLYGFAIIGVRVNRNDLFERRTVKAFEHNHPSDWKVCPTTGRQLWVSEEVPRDGYVEGNGSFQGYEVISGDYGNDGTHRAYFISLVSTKPTDAEGTPTTHMPFDPTGLAQAMPAFKETLQRYGLWRPETFGLWSLLHVSC